MSPFALLLAMILTTPASVYATVDAPDTLVICPRAFQPTMQRWVQYRETQGHKVIVRAPADNSYSIREQVKAFAKQGNLKNVVIVGDAIAGVQQQHLTVPTDYVAAKVNVLFGSEPEILSLIHI